MRLSFNKAFIAEKVWKKGAPNTAVFLSSFYVMSVHLIIIVTETLSCLSLYPPPKFIVIPSFSDGGKKNEANNKVLLLL